MDRRRALLMTCFYIVSPSAASTPNGVMQGREPHWKGTQVPLATGLAFAIRITRSGLTNTSARTLLLLNPPELHFLNRLLALEGLAMRTFPGECRSLRYLSGVRMS